MPDGKKIAAALMESVLWPLPAMAFDFQVNCSVAWKFAIAMSFFCQPERIVSDFFVRGGLAVLSLRWRMDA